MTLRHFGLTGYFSLHIDYFVLPPPYLTPHEEKVQMIHVMKIFWIICF